MNSDEAVCRLLICILIQYVIIEFGFQDQVVQIFIRYYRSLKNA
jgi:hypothetical protein